MRKSLWSFFAAVSLCLIPSFGQAAVSYTFLLKDLAGKSSVNSSLLGYDVRIGKFASGFTPGSGNYDQWLSNFTLLPPATFTLVDDTQSFLEPGAGDFGPFISSVDSFSISSNVPGFSSGDPLYVWISNSTSSGANTQAALLTDSTWQYSNVTGGPGDFPVTIDFRNTDPSLLVGTLFDDSFVDGGGEPGLRLVTQNINSVPEPTQSLLVFVGLMTLVARRRRRNMI